MRGRRLVGRTYHGRFGDDVRTVPALVEAGGIFGDDSQGDRPADRHLQRHRLIGGGRVHVRLGRRIEQFRRGDDRHRRGIFAHRQRRADRQSRQKLWPGRAYSGRPRRAALHFRT